MKEGKDRRNYNLTEEIYFLQDMCRMISHAQHIVGKKNYIKLRKQLHECIGLILDNIDKPYHFLCKANGSEYDLIFTDINSWCKKINDYWVYLGRRKSK